MGLPRVSFRRLVKPLLLALLVGGALLSSRTDLGRAYQAAAGSLHHFAELVVGVGARPLSAMASALRDRTHQPEHFQQLVQANRRIESQQNVILRLWRENQQLQRENAALQEIRRQLGRQRYTFRPARVMSRSTDPASRTVTLNRGADAGLVKGAAVVSGPHLVGRVVEVGRLTADVQLVTAPGTTFQALITPPVWTVESMPEQRLRQPARFEHQGGRRFDAIAHEDMQANIGDVAHLSDPSPRWPASAQGMIVGEVVKIAPVHEPPLRKKIVIEPIDELFYRDRVVVVLPKLE
ncbi:MAG: hypothetical protein GVY24_04870 [Planctomycetes bacterium]|jgi:cell shape-determining protein MreC|nr:hypothetical protein [Planctomycetota bacterium]